MPDTPLTQTDNEQTQETVGTTQTNTQAPPPAFSWKAHLNPDFANSPTMQKFPDTKEGFNDAVKSHLGLEKMMGHEKVPVPKGPDDPAMALFKKAFRIPEKPDGYGLGDPDVPESMKGLTFDKAKFSEAMLKHNATPEQAKGFWGVYQDMVKQQYADALKKQQEAVTASTNTLRSEWGDAYQSKVELGQHVINKFSDDKDMNDFITATLVRDPRGVKFLSKIGEQFAENNVGDFKYQRHSLTPDEARREIQAIKNDPNHPYNNERAPQSDRSSAIDYVNSLYGVIARAR